MCIILDLFFGVLGLMSGSNVYKDKQCKKQFENLFKKFKYQNMISIWTI